MKICRTVLIVCSFCFVFNGSLVFSQNVESSSGKSFSTRTKDKGKNGEKLEPGDYLPTNEFKSPFRYIIVDSDLQFDDEEEKVPTRHFVTILMEERAFNEPNLIYLFKYLSNYYADPLYLVIDVHTSLITLQTPEEGAVAASRDDFRQFYKTATFSRSNDIHEKCSAGFLYDTGKAGKFIMKDVRLTCPTKK